MPDDSTGGIRHAFRWSRGFTLFLAIAAVGFAAGIGGMLFSVVVGESPWILLPAIPIGLAGALVGYIAYGSRKAHATVTAEGVAIYFPTSMNTVIPWSNIAGAHVTNHGFIYGLGIRTNLAGHVALATAWGPAAELALRQGVRAGILPRIWWTTARDLRLTIEDPEQFVAEVTARLVPGVEP